MPRFSDRPGARERHLQRKCDNPLFPPAARAVSQDQVTLARQEDVGELQAFQAELREAVEQAVNLRPTEESEVILRLKERLDRLYEQAAGLREDQAQARLALRQLVAVVMRAVWKGAGNDARAQAELEEEEQARAAHYALLEQPLVADLLRPDSPITAGELAPTLLSADAEALAAALTLFDADQVEALCGQARLLLQEQPAGDPRIDQAWLRLRQMESAAAGGAAATH